MRITRVYTRTGDTGDTRLVGGSLTQKDSPRVAAYGDVDELNSVIGLCRTFNSRETIRGQTIDQILEAIQNDLFNVGTELATRAEDRWEGMYRVGDTEVLRLESQIDTLNEDLEPLKEFILPGGGPVGAFLHQARTVCRRSERTTVALRREEVEAGGEGLRYLNRLSDLLFVLARWAAWAHSEPEYFWKNPAKRSSSKS